MVSGHLADSQTLAVVSVGSNSVTLIDTGTNQVKGTVYLGRSPHEAFFTPDGREVWVTVRGEDYVSVIDPVQMKETRRIAMANGPGMTMFGPDGKYAFCLFQLSTRNSRSLTRRRIKSLSAYLKPAHFAPTSLSVRTMRRSGSP